MSKMMHNVYNYANETKVSIKYFSTIFTFPGDYLNYGAKGDLLRITQTGFRNHFFDVSLFSLIKYSQPNQAPLCWLQMG